MKDLTTPVPSDGAGVLRYIEFARQSAFSLADNSFGMGTTDPLRIGRLAQVIGGEDLSELHRVEVDGVTTYWVETPGPLRAQLLFRTGVLDESLPTHGHTHLIEHTVLSALNDGSMRHNGFVGGVVTGFNTVGTESDVADFLRGVCETLGDLPADRLDAEKQILSAEAAQRPHNVLDDIARCRYGAVGYGLYGMKELGLSTATIDVLRRRAERSFTSGNAVLCLTGEPPADLRLSLPPGSRLPIPELRPLPRCFPGFVPDGSLGGAMASMIVERSWAGSVFRQIASRRLNEVLRTGLALSYSPSVGYGYLDASVAQLTLYADSEVEKHGQLAQAFGDLFEHLGDVESSEVDSAKQELLDRMVGPLAPSDDAMLFQDVDRAAYDDIYGTPFETCEQLAEGLSAVTCEEVECFFSESRESVIFGLPAKVKKAAWMGERAQSCLETPVTGKALRSKDATEEKRLTLAEQGVTLRWPDKSHRTVRYESAVAALKWDDGAVCLVGPDATSFTIEPPFWPGGLKTTSGVLDHFPAEKIVDLGTRPPNEIPKIAPLGKRLGAMQRRLARSPAIFVLAGVLLLASLMFAGPTAGQPNNVLPALLVPSAIVVYSLIVGGRVGARSMAKQKAPTSVPGQAAVPTKPTKRSIRTFLLVALGIVVVIALLGMAFSAYDGYLADRRLHLLSTAPADPSKMRLQTFRLNSTYTSSEGIPVLRVSSMSDARDSYVIGLDPSDKFAIDKHWTSMNAFFTAASQDRLRDCQIAFTRDRFVGFNLIVSNGQ